ncbi:hypothetical protein AB0D08_31550 [Kitasatospora sp. NPDC048540]|uniref:hypothetical protein n=1 Tax=unclassified Kitasatospora TaxID=2633591 RepID=UPI001314BE7A|nr:hypothetical protein [Kitasatospora sp. MBT63]
MEEQDARARIRWLYGGGSVIGPAFTGQRDSLFRSSESGVQEGGTHAIHPFG